MKNNDLLQEIKKQLSFQKIFDYYSIDYKNGGNYVLGECPFCKGTTKEYDLASYDSGKTWCFDCGWKGDVLKFIMDYENIDFVNSMKKACEILGIEFKINNLDNNKLKEIKKKQEEKKAAEELFKKKIDQYHKNLINNFSDLVDYCLERGLTKESLKKFKIGFVNDEKPSEELLKCGLCGKTKEGKIFFPFKNRLVIPYLNSKQDPVFAIFRQTKYTYVPKDENGNPKDVRFKKLYSGKDSLLENTLFYSNHRKTKTLVIAEGIFDVLNVAQNEFSAASFITIRPSANNIKEIIPIISAYDSAVIIFDNEENNSGEKGTIATIETLYKSGLTNIKTFVIPKPENIEKIDLNDVLKSLDIDKQKNKINEMILQSTYAVDFLCDVLNFSNATEKSKSLHKLGELFKTFYKNDKVFYDAVINDISKKTGLTKKSINDAFLYEVKKEQGAKEDSKDNEDVKKVFVSELTHKETFYEIVADEKEARFVSLDKNGKPVFSKSILNEDCEHDTDYSCEVYYPIYNNIVKKRAVILPKSIIDYESEEKLLEEIQNFIHKYVDVSEDYELFASYYVLLSWVYDSVTTIPYLRALADFSCGKSRFLETIGKICYRPLVMSGAVSPAAFFRLQGVWKGTALLDEADRNKSDETDILITTLNCGFEKGKPVLRAGTNDPNDIEAFDPFGPKIITTRYPFKDQALESRCLTEKMRSTERDDIPTILPKEFYDEQEKLRQKLLMFRLKEINKIDSNKIQDINLGNIERRLKQALSSFAVLFVHKKELFEKFKRFVLDYQTQLISERETSFDGLIVNYLADFKDKDEKDQISAGDIVQYLSDEYRSKADARYVGHRLKGLGIDTKPKKIDKKTKRVIEWDNKFMDKLFQKYNSEYWLEKNGDKIGEKKVSLVSKVTLVTDAPPLKNIKKISKKKDTKLSEFTEGTEKNTKKTEFKQKCEDCKKEFNEKDLKKVKFDDGTIFNLCETCAKETLTAGGVLA